MRPYPDRAYLGEPYLLPLDAYIPVHNIRSIALPAVMLALVSRIAIILSHPVVSERCFEIELGIA